MIITKRHQPDHRVYQFINTATPPLLILLFVYAAVSKLMTFEEFKGQMLNQTFPHVLARVLVYVIPSLEVLTSLLLIFTRTLRYGLILSAIMLAAFSGYILLVILHFWNRVPCSCGGILNHFTWTQHLIFNMFYLLLNCAALFSNRIKPA